MYWGQGRAGQGTASLPRVGMGGEPEAEHTMISIYYIILTVSAQMSQDHMQTCVGWRRWRRGGSSVGRRPRSSHLVDAETRTAFHFLISKRGGGGSSFFSSAAGPSLVSIADIWLTAPSAACHHSARQALRDSAVQ